MPIFSPKKNSTGSTGDSSAETAAAPETKAGGGGTMIPKKMDTPGSPGGSAPSDVKAILGKGSEFEGKLRFEGTARIDGKFKGEVHSTGTLIIGEHASIDGDLFVDGAIVSGEVHGNITAKNRLELHAPAKLFGNIQAPTLAIQEGVIFDGNCMMSKSGQAGAVKPSPAKEPTSAS
jgi:cytoskeletal protein CcmA (bactofilin family)